MTIPSIQQSFSVGEISPELFGEVSLNKFSSAASTMRNFVPNYKGGAFSRAGFALVGVSLQSTYLANGTSTGPPVPIPFQFSIDQSYILEFGDNYLRFIFQGGYVLENPFTIFNATKADPCVLSVTGTPFANGDWVFIANVAGMTQLNGQTFIVSGVSSGHLQLNDLQGNPLDSTAYSVYTGGGTVQRLYTLATPYAAVDLPYLKFSQSADVMSLTCSNPITQTEYPPYDLTRLSAIDWTLIKTDFDAVIQPPATVSAAANTKQTVSPNINATFNYEVTAVDRQGNESVASAVASCNGTDIEVIGGANTVTWSGVSGAAYYNVYRSPASVNSGGAIPVPAGSIFGYVGSAYGTQLVDSDSSRDISQTPPTHQNPFAPGQILAVNIISGGSGLTDVNYTITSAAGENFNGYAAVTGGALGAFVVTSNGENYQPGDTISFNGVGFASGAIEFGTTNPSPFDTVTLNGIVWTFVNQVRAPRQTLIGGSLAGTLVQLAYDLSAATSDALTSAAYSVDNTNSNLLISYNSAGPGGNSYTLAASAATVSGPTLTGGSGSGAAGTNSTGSLLFGSNPTNGQTIVLDGVTWTFVTSGATGNQTNIGGSTTATLATLATDLTASSNANLQLANYSASGPVLDVEYKTVGTIGNSYTLGAGTSGATLSGATLRGGTDASVTPSGTLVIGPESGTYPGVNVYFQQRHFFACSFNDPDTFWASQTALFQNFDTSIPTVATDAVTASPWTEQVNGIQWMIPMPGGLIAMTGRRAWQILGEGSYILNVQPITPSTVQAQPQAFNGCSATVRPIVIDYDVLYAEAVGNTTVRDLSWTAYTNIYTGVDLTILSSHLFLYRNIVQWAWARNPYKVVWACCNDGTMLSLTYLKEQEVYGWARHDTDGLVVGIASVTEPPVDAVYVAVNRFPPYANILGIYTMERMDNRIWQSVEDAYAVDSGVSSEMDASQSPITASAASGGGIVFRSFGFTADAPGRIIRMAGGIATVETFINQTEVHGSWVLPASPGPFGLPRAAPGDWTISTPVTTLNAPHLAGMTVVGLADGVPIPRAGIDPPIVVSASGLVKLPFAASDVKIGLPFLPQLQTPYLNGPQVAQGTRKVIPSATVRLSASAQFMFGTNRPDGSTQNPQQLGPTWDGMTKFNPLSATGGQKRDAGRRDGGFFMDGRPPRRDRKNG
jgi:hypothetical protein